MYSSPHSKRKIGPIALKLGLWAPIQNRYLMADLVEKHIFKKIHVAAENLRVYPKEGFWTFLFPAFPLPPLSPSNLGATILGCVHYYIR